MYDAIGLELTADAGAAMRRWLSERPREGKRPDHRVAHLWTQRAEQVDDRFAAYNTRFRTESSRRS